MVAMEFKFRDYAGGEITIKRNVDGEWALEASTNGVHVTPLGLRRLANAIEQTTQVDEASDPEE